MAAAVGDNEEEVADGDGGHGRRRRRTWQTATAEGETHPTELHVRPVKSWGDCTDVAEDAERSGAIDPDGILSAPVDRLSPTSLSPSPFLPRLSPHPLLSVLAVSNPFLVVQLVVPATAVIV